MNKKLPRSTPEVENISQKGLDAYLATIEKSGLKYDSIMLVRHGKVVFEKFFRGYDPEEPHPLYSIAKIVTAVACWFALHEKLFDVHDKVVSYFPDQVPDRISLFLEELEIFHLLTMTVGHKASELSMEADSGNDEWIKLFLSAPIQHKPGTVFEYNNLASYMLSALIQKRSGHKLIDYIRPRLFEPLGIEDTGWEESPEGINVAGWGMSLRTEDIAKIGQFMLQKGRWEDKELLPEALVEDACSFKVETAPPTATKEQKDRNDWFQGYCYHVWRSRHNAFSGYGLKGQLIVVMPDKDAVAVVTGDITAIQGELNLIWKYVLPAMKENPI